MREQVFSDDQVADEAEATCREDVTSLSLGRNTKMVPSVLRTGTEERK